MRLVTRNVARRRDGVQPHEDGRGIDDLLEVVEHDEHPAVGERARDALLERGFAVVADAEVVRDRRQQQSAARARPRASTKYMPSGNRSLARQRASRSRAGSCRCRPGR